MTLPDLTFQAQTINTVSMQTSLIFLLVMLVYFGLSQGLGAAFRAWERHAARWRYASGR